MVRLQLNITENRLDFHRRRWLRCSHGNERPVSVMDMSLEELENCNL